MKPKIDHIHVTVADIKRAEVDAVFARVSAIPAVIARPGVMRNTVPITMHFSLRIPRASNMKL